jgi:hypothetical protein
VSRTEALRRAGQLREALLDYGIRKVSIEIMQGRPGTPNDRWWDKRFIGTMGHHIVSLRSQGLTPGLALAKRGRTDVPGPLCNGYGGFDLIARIICMGWANHPGAGGPYTLPGGTVPKDAARPYLFGWEFEGGVREADWTDSMRNFMGRCHAGTLDWLGRGSGSHIEHKTWAPTRKIDRLRYTLADARAEIRRQPRLASGGTSGGGVTIPSPPGGGGFDPEEDDMPAPKDWDAEDWGAFAAKLQVKDPLDGDKLKSLGTILRHWLRVPVAEIATQTGALPQKVWDDSLIPRVNPDGTPGDEASAAEHLRWTRRSADVAQGRAKDMLDALAPLLSAAAAGEGLLAAEVQQVAEACSAALDSDAPA